MFQVRRLLLPSHYAHISPCIHFKPPQPIKVHLQRLLCDKNPRKNLNYGAAVIFYRNHGNDYLVHTYNTQTSRHKSWPFETSKRVFSIKRVFSLLHVQELTAFSQNLTMDCLGKPPEYSRVWNIHLLGQSSHWLFSTVKISQVGKSIQVFFLVT